MYKTKFSTLLCICALGMPLASLAAGDAEKAAPKDQSHETPAPKGAEGRSASPLFMQLDANKDGYVDAGEANKSATVKGNFKAMDTNGDGRISNEEWSKFESGGSHSGQY